MPNITQFSTRDKYLEWYRIYRKKNAEKLRIYNRKYNQLWRRENGLHNEINSKKKYPEKEFARKLLRSAVNKGLIKRGNCEICETPNGQGHHDNYYKPLEVRWFCPLHHRKHHKHIGDFT